MRKEPITPGHWHVPVKAEDVPETGYHVSISADPTTRAAIAADIGLQSLDRFDASFDVTRRGHGGLHVSGEVNAAVGQTCVVTLEPVENTVTEVVDVDFVPTLAEQSTAGPGFALASDEDAEEPLEPLVDGTVDLGALAVEFLILGIDPYPRKPGAKFAAPQSEGGDSGPFVALAKLKQASDKGK